MGGKWGGSRCLQTYKTEENTGLCLAKDMVNGSSLQLDHPSKDSITSCGMKGHCGAHPALRLAHREGGRMRRTPLGLALHLLVWSVGGGTLRA